MERSEMLNLITEYLIKEVRPYAILLFGSLADGPWRTDSDIDIAFLSREATSDYDLFLKGQYLAGKIGREIDLVDLNKASTVLKAQVVGKGKPIYVGDEKRFVEFQIRALKEYVKLNEERAQVFEAISNRGRVYG